MSIIPSGTFASENDPSVNQTNSTNDYRFKKMIPEYMRHGKAECDKMHCTGFDPAENITDENFTQVQTTVLDSIAEKIAGLQNIYTNVSGATTAEELQEVLLAEKQANFERIGPHEKNEFPGKMCGLCLFEVENITDGNLTDVQTEIVGSIGNMTDTLNEKLENTTDDNTTEILNEQIAELEELSASVSNASSAEELQEVVLTYMKSQAVELIEKEIKHIETRVNESKNSTYVNVTELNNKITELTILIEDINATESPEELREIMFSEMKHENGSMHRGRGSTNEGRGPNGGCGKMQKGPCLHNITEL